MTLYISYSSHPSQHGESVVTVPCTGTLLEVVTTNMMQVRVFQEVSLILPSNWFSKGKKQPLWQWVRRKHELLTWVSVIKLKVLVGFIFLTILRVVRKHKQHVLQETKEYNMKSVISSENN